MCLGLPLTNNLPQQRLQTLHIIMLEHPHIRSTQPDPKPNRRMVELIRDNKAPLTHQCRDKRRIRCEPHRTDQRVLHPHKARHKRLAHRMQIAVPALQPRSACGYAVALDGLLDGIGASAACLSEPEVVVGGDVECARARAGEDLGVVVVGRDTVEEDDGATGNACYGLGKAFVHAGFEAAGVEGIEVGIERGITLSGKSNVSGSWTSIMGSRVRFRQLVR